MTQNIVDKNNLINRFSKAKKTYDDNAVIQREIANHMISILKDNGMPNNIKSVLEIGCGTGYFSQLLNNNFNIQKLYLNDICRELCSTINIGDANNISFLIGDAEKIDFPKELNLITSCSAVQWFENLEGFLENCLKAISPKGFLAFSSFGPENFKELRELSGKGLEYLDIGELQKLVGKYFDVIYSEEYTNVQYFKTPKDVLKHLKLTGVTATNSSSWNKSDLEKFTNEYNKMYLKDGQVCLTYHPIFIIAKNIK